MRKNLVFNTMIKKWLLVLAVFFVGIFYGISIMKWEIFPYKMFKSTYKFIISKFKFHPELVGSWTIGLYCGDDLFQVQECSFVKNPIISATMVDDVSALFVADPFMIKKYGKYYIFFEVFNQVSRQGDIGVAESNDLIHWQYLGIILDEPFHLSYPYVFESKHDGNIYMIVESHEDVSVRLYMAKKFPFEWVFLRRLLSGYHYVDPSIVYFNGKWWLFVSCQENDVLNIYYSDNLLGPYHGHIKNPVVKNNKMIARPGGRILFYDGFLYRFAQDDSLGYGKAVNAFKIIKLSETEYFEQPINKNPILKPSSVWNKYGIHNIDCIKEDKWYCVVDGHSEHFIRIFKFK